MTGTTRRGTRTSAKQREVGQGSEAASRLEPSLPMLRTSERGALKRCEFLWDMAYNRRVKNAGADMPALRFGSLAHLALADYYPKGIKRGVHPAKAFKKHYDADMMRNREIFGMKVDDDEVWVNAEELGIAMLENYVDEYRGDTDWEVIATEMPFKVLVHHPVSGKPWFWYTGVVDGVWKHRRTKELWIPDHKTTKAIHKKLSYLQMDDQAGSYWSFGVQFLVQQGFLKVNQQLHGMLYNFLRKSMPDERVSKLGANGQRVYLNKDGSISKKQPSPYFLRMPIYRDEYDRDMAVRRAMTDYKRIEMLRAGTLEMSKSPGMFTCPGCPAMDACELHETGHDFETFIKQTTESWEPYAQHEIYDGR